MHGANVFDPCCGRGKRFRLESHAAFRASAGLRLAHLRVHRADVCARAFVRFRSSISFCCAIYRTRHGLMLVSLMPSRLLEERFRVRDEFHHASPTAKVICLFSVFLFSGGAPRIYGHAADRVGNALPFVATLPCRRSAPDAGRFHVLRRVFAELVDAVLAAKIISLPVVLVLPGSVVGIHGHAADGVGGHASLVSWLSFCLSA